jgi:hypothetical protein
VQGGFYKNALQAAFVKGHEVIVELLLGAGAEWLQNASEVHFPRIKSTEDDVFSSNESKSASLMWSGQQNTVTAPSSFLSAELKKNQRVTEKAPLNDSVGNDSDIQSLASIGEDISSMIMSDSASSGVRDAAGDYLVGKFTDDEELRNLYQEAIQQLSEERFIRNNRRLLKQYFLDLNGEKKTPPQRLAVRFLRSRTERTRISNKICRFFSPSEVTLPDQMDVQLKEERLKSYLANQRLIQEGTAIGASTTATDFIPNTMEENDTTSEISESSNEFPDTEDEEGSEETSSGLVHGELEAAARFLTSGCPFNSYKERLRNFLRQKSRPTSFTLRELIDDLDVQAVCSLLERAFDDVAKDNFEWLHELTELGYSYQEIASLLVEEKTNSPWLIFTPRKIPRSRIRVDLHQPACVHLGGQRLTMSPRLITHDPGHCTTEPRNAPQVLESATIKRNVAEACGLAGILPISLNAQDWNGCVTFKANNPTIASVSYEIDCSYTLTNSQRQNCLIRINNALEKLLDLIDWLQQNELCCNSFTILSLLSGEGPVEVVRIPFSLVKLFEATVAYLASEDLSEDRFGSALQCSREVLDLVYGKDKNALYNLGMELPVQESQPLATIQSCALATQSLCVGLLSYSNAHVGSLQPFFLSHALNTVNFMGIRDPSAIEGVVSAQLMKLTCVGNMVKEPVLLFSIFKNLPRNEASHLLVSPEDLIDTWGPGRFIIDPGSNGDQKIYAIEIGGGNIRKLEDDLDIFHWEKGSLKYASLTRTFDCRKKILIGATQYNSSCPLVQDKALPGCASFLEHLGTSRDCWRPIESEVGIQLGQYALAQFSVRWEKQKGVTLKDQKLNAPHHIIDLPFLELPWGLQVSLCTGVARRVRIREMLADVMAIYIKQHLFINPLWDDLLHVHDILHALREPDLGRWINNLSPDLQELVAKTVRYVLDVLRCTGFDESHEEFVIAWPLDEDPFLCFRIHCQDDNLWTRALADSTDCATFAYVTPRCLETSDYKCRRLSAVRWHNSAVSLDTAVCQHIVSKNSGDEDLTWSLKPGMPYWIGKPGADLKATVLASASQVETRLSISRSRVPEWYRKKIGTKHRIREKQSLDNNAQQVLILSMK